MTAQITSKKAVDKVLLQSSSHEIEVLSGEEQLNSAIRTEVDDDDVDDQEEEQHRGRRKKAMGA